MRILTIIVVLTMSFVIACGDDGGNDPNNPQTGDDPWALSTWFNGTGLENREEAVNLDAAGRPTGSSPSLGGYPFVAPSAWAGRAVTGLVSTDYVGAFDPSGVDWTDGWTVGLDGREAVWGPPVTTPTADGSCPAGTTVHAKPFSTFFDEGASVDVELVNDEAGLFTAAADYDVCMLPRTITSDLTLTPDNVYKVQDGFPGTKVGTGDDDDGSDDATIVTVQAGTLIFGDEQEAFVVTRGSEIVANGSATAPIVFTSAKQLSQRFDGDTSTAVDTGRGEWAGLALMGKARSNECGSSFDNCHVEAEGNIGKYGGNDDTDSSGVLNYVVVRHAGNDIDGQGNELNGISYFGTGSGTVSDYIQVHNNLDDGIEHFGSADFVSHAVLTGNADDSVDWGQGWTGGVQFVVVVQAADAADHGIEADNDKTNPDAEPISNVLIANATFLGQSDGETTSGILLRRGTKAQLWNTIIAGFAGGGIDIDDDATFARAGSDPANPASDLMMKNSVVDCSVAFIEE